ncbi:hypothetical protein NGM37_39795, partial [Streptomyces sp. TRM76130]|nr:hypothetical protein [Streptomyces sp. TRM76130]
APARPATATRAGALPDALLQSLHPWDVFAADAVHRWARVAALRSSRTPDLDAELARRPDFMSTQGLRYAHETSAGSIRPRLEEVLRHRYEVMAGGRTVRVGFELTGARPLGPAEGVRFKARRYQQDDEDHEHTEQRARG